jgi:predicted kinase
MLQPQANMATDKLIIVMVGLPARGKSYITKKISNYLNWLNIQNRVFNVGNRRRVLCDDKQNADFFNPNHEENVKMRDLLAVETLDEVLKYLNHQGQAAIFDATNSTVARRNMVVQHIDTKAKEMGLGAYNVVFLESICDDANVIEGNMLLKLNGPDYKDNANKLEALNDFKKRLMNYESVYQTMTPEEIIHDNCSYIKIVNVLTIKSFNIQGFLPIILSSFLKNFNIYKKKIWLSLNHVEYPELSNTIDSSALVVMNNTDSADKTIPAELSLDQVHDLILEIEASKTDILIQTGCELLINGIFKYFNLIEECHPDLCTQLVCIHPHLYSVGLQKFNILEIPEMTRSNSNISNVSSVYTPRDEMDFTKFNYKNLNLGELQTKLSLLDQS